MIEQQHSGQMDGRNRRRGYWKRKNWRRRNQRRNWRRRRNPRRRKEVEIKQSTWDQ
jgi:hypothetical protein